MENTELEEVPPKSHDQSTNIKTNTKPQNDATPKIANFRSIFHYPAGAYFCLGNEFSERFSFYGMKAVLIIYLISVHGLSQTNAKLLYHSFVFTICFAPIFGAILADGFFGRYPIILYVSIVYCIGHLLLTTGAIPSLGLSIMKSLDYTGLFVIALATGGIKPCVGAFAADQFPDNMEHERTQFFSFFYFMVNLGAFMSVIITPILRRQPCMNSDTCFPLAFGIPAIVMFLATFIFWLGTPWYKINRVRNNVITRVGQCVIYALIRKYKSKEKKAHWLDYAYPKYDQILIHDIKALFDIILLFIPVVLFWALYEQMGSTWVIQGNQMNGRVGNLTILPDQMGALNGILVILFIPLFEGFIYPTLGKFGIWTRSLRRMGWGGVLIIVSFIMAGFLQLSIDHTAIKMPRSGLIRLSIINFLKCDIHISDTTNNFSVLANSSNFCDVIPDNVTLMVGQVINKNSLITDQSIDRPNWSTKTLEPLSESNSAYFVTLFPDPNVNAIPYQLKKTPDGKTRIYFVFETRHNLDFNFSITVEQDETIKGTVGYSLYDNQSTKIDLEPGLYGSNEYDIYLRHCAEEIKTDNCTKEHLKRFQAITGAVHVLVVPANNEKETYRMEELIQANSVSMMWQIPQYIIITVAEILFSISGLAFSYSQASPRMKSVFQAIWILTSAFGNLIDMGLSGSGTFENKPAIEFFVYSIIMSGVMCLFTILARNYKDKSFMYNL